MARGTRREWWLEQEGEITPLDRWAERHDDPGHPASWDTTGVQVAAPDPRRLDLWVSTLWMVIWVLVFAWAPIFNGFLAGAFGGWRARTLRRALAASLLSTLIWGGALWVTFLARGHTNGFFMGMRFSSWVAVTLVSLLVGAWLGVVSRYAIREDEGPVSRWVGGPWNRTPRERPFSGA